MNVIYRYVEFSLVTETITADFFAFGEKICVMCIENFRWGTDARYLSERETIGDLTAA